MKAVQVLYLLYALAMVNWGFGIAALKSFLSGTQAIASNLDLQNFATLVRRHMFQAMLQVVLLVAGMFLGIYILVTGKAGFLLIIAMNGFIFAAGMLGKPLEERARSLKVLDLLLEERYKAICTTWVEKPFPDF